jgi:hypothetical protein
MKQGRIFMAEQDLTSARGDPEIPLGQRLFDRIFLLLIVSLLISGVLYNLWGLLEVLDAPPLPIR